MKSSEKTLRKKISSRILQTEIPIIVYAVVLISMFLLWRYRAYNEEIAMNFFAELFGAAFTLFIIDVLLVRSKAKRWKVVREDINYLIARNVNRIRDGISTRVFNFNPDVDHTLPRNEYLTIVRDRRGDFLTNLVTLEIDEVMKMIDEEALFSEAGYEYFNEKADEIWNILNVKYSDFFHPQLASYLIELNVNLKDLAGHIRQYMKHKRFMSKGEKYKNIGREGAIISIQRTVVILNLLKDEGYSEMASFDYSEP